MTYDDEMTLDDVARLLEAFIKTRQDMTTEQKQILVDLLVFASLWIK